MSSEKKSLAEIVKPLGTLEDFQANDKFLGVVNQEPPKSFIKEHPIAKGVKYIPIDKIELMLDMIFQRWNVEIIESGQLFNSVYTIVRLYYKHPITGEKEHHDGVGAVQVQVDKGESASNLSAIKSNAIMLALPASKSYAIKDAADHIGKIFGRDINRKDTIPFTAKYGVSSAGSVKPEASDEDKKLVADTAADILAQAKSGEESQDDEDKA